MEKQSFVVLNPLRVWNSEFLPKLLGMLVVFPVMIGGGIWLGLIWQVVVILGLCGGAVFVVPCFYALAVRPLWIELGNEIKVGWTFKSSSVFPWSMAGHISFSQFNRMSATALQGIPFTVSERHMSLQHIFGETYVVAVNSDCEGKVRGFLEENGISITFVGSEH